MFNKQLVRDHYGQYYKIQTNRDKSAPSALKPEPFYSASQAYRFINNLVVSANYWKAIYNQQSQYNTTARNEIELRNNIAELFAKGSLKAYRVEAPSSTEKPPQKRTLTNGSKDKHIFTSASTLLISNPKEVMSFASKKEAAEFVSGLSPDRVSLQNLVEELELPKTTQDDEFGELVDLVATGLASGEIIVLLDKYTTPPPSSGNDDGAAMQGDKDASKGPDKPECTFDVMTVECSHFSKGRSYKLDVIKDKPNLNGYDKALQVIAKPGDPDKITVTYSGSCANGSKQCPSIKISSDTLNGTFTDNPYKFDALPLEDEREPGDFIDFLKYYLVPDLSGLKYQVYTIEKSGCNGNEGNIGKVHAFPTFKWDGSVSLGYQQPDATNNDGKEFGKKKKKSEWKLAVKLDGNVGKKNWSFEKNSSDEADRFLPEIQNSIRGLVYKLDDYYRKASEGKGLVKFTVDWPSISIGGNIELLENKQDFNVDIGGEVYINMSPLLKADVRMDLLEWLLLFTTPLGPFLQKIKTKAADDGIGTDNVNAKAVIAIELILTGDASTTLNWKKAAHEKWLDTSGDKTGEAKAGVTIGLEAKVRAEAKIFYVKITMGAELHVKGANNASEGIGVFLSLFATTEKDKPAIGGKVNFTGAAIYYTYYAEIGSDEVVSEQEKQQLNRRRGSNQFASKEAQKETKAKENRMEKLTEIFKADEWPKSSEKSIDLSKVE